MDSADSPKFRSMLKRSKRSIEEGKGLSEGDFWKAVRDRAAGKKAHQPKRRGKKASPGTR